MLCIPIGNINTRESLRRGKKLREGEKRNIQDIRIKMPRGGTQTAPDVIGPTLLLHDMPKNLFLLTFMIRSSTTLLVLKDIHINETTSDN